jgi:D-glycero-alpha-D-manno-heptose 1-phosphate guanylyltransferase
VRFNEGTLAVESFEEKGLRGPGWINAGAYVLSQIALRDVVAGRPASLERDVLPGLVGRGLVAVPYPGATFLDIGTPDDYAAAANILTARPAS